MKVLFAVRDEKVSLSIVKKYQKEYKEIISYKNVYYFNAILKELQRDNSYDRVVIDEELEEFTSTSYEEKDKFIFNKLDNITDEASNTKGKDVPIILICSERRTKSEDILVKMFGIGIYNAIIGNDRSTDEVCRLINQPRTKKDAKLYYKIYSKDVDYDPENEDDVSEEEMQHILSYFKRLGKNEESYVEAFRKIVSQYSEKQMRVIIAILPLNVKAVLEESSTEYQKIVAASGGRIARRTIKTPESAPTSEKLLDGNTKRTDRPIVIPSSIDKNLIKKVTIRKPTIEKPPVVEDEEEEDDFDDILNDFEDVNIEPNNIDVEEPQDIEEVQEVKPKRRGRPPKKTVETEIQEEPKKKRRGRPPKKALVEEIEEPEEIEEIEEVEEPDILPGFENVEKYQETTKLPGFEDVSDSPSTSLPGFENVEDDEEFESINSTHSVGRQPEDFLRNDRSHSELRRYEQDYDDYDYTNYNNLLSSDRKVVAFVGTSKNGTSFIVNNVAKILSERGINTAILDATQNKNSYYIFNNNEDELRNAAADSIGSLVKGNPNGGMQVSKNLSVYVGIPGQEDSNMNNVGPILENLIQNYSAVLIDCDFNTPAKYFENAQEIYLVQSMDVLTIQPLTAFLKELKDKDILEQRKIKVIVNKAVRLRGVSSKQIVGGMSNYNNPEMSIMKELFDRNLIVPIEIPFDPDVYAKYLEGVADCDVSVSKYPKEFQSYLQKLASVIYPLLPSKGGNREKPQKGYQYSSGFSNSVNNTLNNMKRNY